MQAKGQPGVWAAGCILIWSLSACGQGGEELQSRPPLVSGTAQTADYTEGSTSRVPPQAALQTAEGSGSDVEGHPSVDPNQRIADRRIEVPPDVEGKWKAVKLMVRNKQDEEQSRMYTVTLGSTFNPEGTGLAITVGPFLPNFLMDESVYTSNGNELVNPAVHLEVKEGDRTLYEGWAFAKFPGMYAFEHETFALQLMDFIPAEVS